MGLLKFLGLEQQTDQLLLDENKKLKADNLTLISRVGVLESSLKSEKDQTAIYLKGYEEKKSKISELEEEVKGLNEQIEELEADTGKKVTYASARKTMTKAKLKELRARLEAVPSGAQGFCASVSVYDKKTKRLKVVELKSKAEALELVSKAEKGNVDIVI